MVRVMGFRADAVMLLSCASAAVFLYLSARSYVDQFTFNHHSPGFRFSEMHDVVCEPRIKTNNKYQLATAVAEAIPNYVHYVWLLKDATKLQLSFKMFVSVYSTHLYLAPERVYIHTDASADLWERARTEGDEWTRRVLALPQVVYHHVRAPRTTTKGVDIIHFEHQSDFVRLAVLREFGGLYLDVDAVPLRDVAALRNSGFANVIGGAVALRPGHANKLNNGVMMARPHSILMEILYSAAHQVFDGEWSTHSIFLLSYVAKELAAMPSEVLLLHPEAFAPTSWEPKDQKRLFMPKMATPPTSANDTTNETYDGPEPRATCMDAMLWLRDHERSSKGNEWALDFSNTYILHAFDDDIHRIWGWDHVVDLRYVLERRSNYARAVYPAMRHAIDAGVLQEPGIEPVGGGYYK